MSLNDLELSPKILSALFPTSLINLETAVARFPKTPEPTYEEALEPAPPEPVIKYLGNNLKNILVVVTHTDAVHLPDEELNFLTNMLAACKLSLGDVAIINRNNLEEKTYKDLLTNFKSRIVFLFGIEPFSFGLPVSFPHYQVQTVADCTFLYTPSLDEQRNDPLLKSKLWVSLRSIFNI